MFDGHRSSGDISGAVWHLICHMTPQNRVIEESSNFMGGRSSRYVTNLPRLLTIGTVVVGMFLVSQVISQNYAVEESCDFINSSQSSKSPTFQVW